MDIPEEIVNLEESLRQSIKGQDHVIERVASVLKRGELGLTHPDRPKGSFLFLGPTGTGKTEITKVFTRIISNDNADLIRFDMSEYQTKESLETLIGDKSGWNGRLGEALLKSGGNGTLLFDEMEKAHRDMLDIFLQILDDARLTTGTGVTHDLSSFYIVLTSNVGADKLMNSRRLNFTTIEKSVLSAVRQAGFRDEFIGRFSETIVFKRLEYDTLKEIAELNIDREILRLNLVLQEKYGVSFKLEKSPEMVEQVVLKGTNARLGARPIRNYVEKMLQDYLIHTF